MRSAFAFFCPASRFAAVMAILVLAATATMAQPVVGTLSPPNASGAPGSGQMLTFTASDLGGWGAISHFDLIMNNQVSGAQACFFVYFPASNVIALWNDGQTDWAGVVTLGSSSVASNGHCQINAQSSSAAFDGYGTLSLFVNVTFASAWAGSTLQLFEQVVDTSNNSSGSATA